jgi:DNA-binding response OmpR family regulator
VASILLCEADPDVQRLLVLLLERLGHDVVVFGDDERPRGRVDLLVLEPASETGLERARLLRDEHPRLPILCVSVLPDDARHLELGPLAYLAKPFSLDELRDAVERALGLGPCTG